MMMISKMRLILKISLVWNSETLDSGCVALIIFTISMHINANFVSCTFEDVAIDVAARHKIQLRIEWTTLQLSRLSVVAIRAKALSLFR